MEFARGMRKDATDAERKMWGILRSRTLAGWKWRRQYPVGGFVWDFYCVKAGVVVELDGGQHGEERQREYDRERTRRLEELGMEVMRFWDHDVLRQPDVVAETIYRRLEEKCAGK